MEDWKKELNDFADKAAKAVQAGSKDFMSVMDKERKKVEIRAQIGHHERAVTKAYTRLGEAYFNNVENGASMDSAKDVLDLIKSNKKVVELLQEQLKTLEPEPAPAAPEAKAEEEKPADAEFTKKDEQ
jgi:hypothetical protein